MRQDNDLLRSCDESRSLVVDLVTLAIIGVYLAGYLIFSV
jgi:hypothetical protein